MSELKDYLQNVRSALRTANAHETYFPMESELRKGRILSLGRDVGYGLAAYPRKEVMREIQGTYSTLVVSNTFDSIGPCVDNSEWVAAIKQGMAKRGTQ